MSSDLNIESRTEKIIINTLKAEAIKEINKIGFEKASEKLGLSHEAVRALLWPKEWNVAEAIRIAEALNLPTIKKFESLLDGTNLKPESDTEDYPDWKMQ